MYSTCVQLKRKTMNSIRSFHIIKRSIYFGIEQKTPLIYTTNLNCVEQTFYYVFGRKKNLSDTSVSLVLRLGTVRGCDGGKR